MSKSDLESELALFLRINEFPAWETEHRFHPKRKWRFDFAIPSKMIAFEFEGGVFTQGRHSRGVGLSAGGQAKRGQPTQQDTNRSQRLPRESTRPTLPNHNALPNNGTEWYPSPETNP